MGLLWAGEVLLGSIAVVAPLEATRAVGVLTEGAMGEAMEEAVVSLGTPKAAEAKEEVMGEAT